VVEDGGARQVRVVVELPWVNVRRRLRDRLPVGVLAVAGDPLNEKTTEAPNVVTKCPESGPSFGAEDWWSRRKAQANGRFAVHEDVSDGVGIWWVSGPASQDSLQQRLQSLDFCTEGGVVFTSYLVRRVAKAAGYGPRCQVVP
jgi:hypothetical protein